MIIPRLVPICKYYLHAECRPKSALLRKDSGGNRNYILYPTVTPYMRGSSMKTL